MPDDLDYEWLGWLIAHPDEWTPADLATAESLVADQKRAVDESHPKDTRARERMQSVVYSLQSAIQEYRGRHAL